MRILYHVFLCGFSASYPATFCVLLKQAVRKLPASLTHIQKYAYFYSSCDCDKYGKQSSILLDFLEWFSIMLSYATRRLLSLSCLYFFYLFLCGTFSIVLERFWILSQNLPLEPSSLRFFRRCSSFPRRSSLLPILFHCVSSCWNLYVA